MGDLLAILSFGLAFMVFGTIVEMRSQAWYREEKRKLLAARQAVALSEPEEREVRRLLGSLSQGKQS